MRYRISVTIRVLATLALVVSCAPNRNSADHFETLLICGISAVELEGKAKFMGASTIQREEEVLFVLSLIHI